MYPFTRILNSLKGWEYIGNNSYNKNGKSNLSKHVHRNILSTLDRKAGQYLGTKTVYAKGRTFLYKAEPAGDWFENHGHSSTRYLHIYRKVRKN